jgi:hypothetical protein
MNYRSIWGMTILGVLFAAPAVVAQTEPPESKPKLSVLLLETKPSDSNPTFPPRPAEPNPLKPKPESPVHFSKSKFVFLSAAVYGASLADMHQTLAVRNNSWWYEIDPLAKPLVRLPAPAYYTVGLVMATGVNWLSWKMAHSRRWGKLAPIPQLLAISGNIYGFHSNPLLIVSRRCPGLSCASARPLPMAILYQN